MNPEFLPEFALLLAGVLLGAVGIHLLLARRWRRGLGLGAVGVILIAGGYAVGKYGTHWNYSETWRRLTMRPAALVPAADSSSTNMDLEETRSKSLLVGDMLLRVMASDRYVLSADNEPFLTLDSVGSGLLVTCRVAGSHYPDPIRTPRLAATIIQNAVVYCGSDVQALRPDAHTILVQERGKDVLRIRYADPRKIEIVGQFYLSEGAEPSVIALAQGIRWRGTTIPSGSADLRPQGKGRINFDRSGLIQVLPDREGAVRR
jgi:hypothetical protein